MATLGRITAASRIFWARISQNAPHTSNHSHIRKIHLSGKLRSSSVKLTSEQYPKVKRAAFATLTDSDVTSLERLVSGRIITEESELEGYNTDWLRIVKGASRIVVRPKTTEEMSAVVGYCHSRHLAVAPQGGNTGLVAGSVPVFDEVIVSTQLMNNIISLDDVSGTLVCQAGCVLATLDDYVGEHGLTMPLDLGAKGSCHIGGNLATNAGGVRLLRYGSLHGNVLGLEAVMPNGEVLDCMSTLRKDNTGYDLKQLLIGSEGTLGIITKAAILCPQRPRAVNVAFLGCTSFQDVLDIFKTVKSQVGEILSAFEFMDSSAMDVAVDNLRLTNPLSPTPFYILIETGGSDKDNDEERLTIVLEELITQGKAVDGTVATDMTKVHAIWSLRERLAEGLLHDGYCYKYDVSLPLPDFYQLVDDMRQRLEGSAKRVVGYGHVGDGNLHFNATTPEYCQTTMDLLEPFIYDWVAAKKGSISAEHGLGFKKRDYIFHSKSPSAVALMKQIKGLIDPKGIMNPYKLLPSM